MPDTRNTSPHILNTASNLLGICFIVLTSLRVLKLQGDTLIDEFTATAMLGFMVSSILSFLAIRSRSRHAGSMEKVAEIFFLGGLICLFVTTMLITFNIIR